MHRATRTALLSLTLPAAITLTGCYSDRPHDYGRERPPVDQLDSRDAGLQSKDVVAATDQLAADLLAIPEVVESPVRLTMVVTDVENRTTDPRFSYDIFIERLRTNLSRMGRGKVSLIENKAKLADLQIEELDSAPGDRFGQGGRPGAYQPGGIQPEFALYGRITELPNRGTSYYLMQFNVTNLRTREQIWSNFYEVKVAR